MECEAKTFNSRGKHGKIRSTVQTATSQAGGGILMADGLYIKTRRPVMEVLAEKDPLPMDPIPCTDDRGAFEPYARIPCLLPLQYDQDLVKTVANKLGGSASSSRMDAYAFTNLLLWHGQVSKALKEEFALWVEWLSNIHPPWAV